MAVSIDKVYQKVLAIANKEQRGYITPQEFNLFADHVQMEIFEQYFYDINQWTRQHGNDHEYSDMLTSLEEKIAHFEVYNVGLYAFFIDAKKALFAYLSKYYNWGGFDDLYKIGSIRVDYGYGDGYVIAEPENKKSRNSFSHGMGSQLTKPTMKRPTYSRHSAFVDDDKGYMADRIEVSPAGIWNKVTKEYEYAPTHMGGSWMINPRIEMNYIRKPNTPHWGYVVVNQKPLYNATASTSFELHTSEESELIYRILVLAGITLEKPQLTQTAAALETAKIQQEKI